MPIGCKLFTVNDLCGTFFRIPIDEISNIFAFPWEEKQFSWAVIPQGFY